MWRRDLFEGDMEKGKGPGGLDGSSPANLLFHFHGQINFMIYRRCKNWAGVINMQQLMTKQDLK